MSRSSARLRSLMRRSACCSKDSQGFVYVPTVSCISRQRRPASVHARKQRPGGFTNHRVSHPSRHVLHGEVGQADVSDVGVYLVHLGMVTAHRRRLYRFRVLLICEELIHELEHAHRGTDGPSLAFELKDEHVACALRLPARFPFDCIERPYNLAVTGSVCERTTSHQSLFLRPLRQRLM